MGCAPIEGQAVDEEGRSGIDAGLDRKVAVILDVLVVGMVRQAGVELGHVEVEFLGILFVNVVAQVLTAEQLIVIRPEGVLFVGALGGLGGRKGIRMDAGEREITVHQADLAGISGHQGLVGVLLPFPAERALEIAEFDDGDGRIGGTDAGEPIGRYGVTDILRRGCGIDSGTATAPAGWAAPTCEAGVRPQAK